MQEYGLFTGKSAPAGETPSDGSAPGASEILSSITDTNAHAIVSVILMPGASVQLYRARLNTPTDWVPIGDALTESRQVALVLHPSYHYYCKSATAGAQVYFRPAPSTMIFENEAQQGLG